MKIAVIGGGASGMVTAYLLDKSGHQVTVFENQPILGGHIRTLNKNVTTDPQHTGLLLEAGVLEFTLKFHNFLALMQELGVELEPVDLGSGLFFRDGSHFLSATTIRKNFTGIRGLLDWTVFTPNRWYFSGNCGLLRCNSFTIDHYRTIYGASQPAMTG
jgi:uncharacterized protein